MVVNRIEQKCIQKGDFRNPEALPQSLSPGSSQRQRASAAGVGPHGRGQRARGVGDLQRALDHEAALRVDVPGHPQPGCMGGVARSASLTAWTPKRFCSHGVGTSVAVNHVLNFTFLQNPYLNVH